MTSANSYPERNEPDWESEFRGFVYGITAFKAPESYAELKQMVEDSRIPGGTLFDDQIEGLVKLIGNFPDPDAITRSLPYYPEDEAIIFILPSGE